MASNYQRTHGVSEVTASTVTITADAHVGMPVVMNRAAGITATLPAASGSGNFYEFIGAADASGNQIIQVANSSDTMAGFAFLGTDSAGAACFYTAAATDTVTLNGTTTGGYKGWRVKLVDIATNTWQVEVFSEASGTEATPFSAAV